MARMLPNGDYDVSAIEVNALDGGDVNLGNPPTSNIGTDSAYRRESRVEYVRAYIIMM